MQRWSKAEIAWLIQNYNKFTLKELASFLPNRPYNGIRKKAKRMGLGLHRPIVCYPIDELTGRQLAYFLGLIEGGGIITIEQWKYKTSTGKTSIRYTPLISIADTSYELLENLRQIIKSGCIRKVKLKDGRKQRYLLRIRGYRPVLSIIDRILQHLVVKKRVAESVRKFIETNDQNVITEIRMLNARSEACRGA